MKKQILDQKNLKMKSVLERAEAEEKALAGEDSDVQDFKIDGDSVKVENMDTNEEDESKP